MTERRIGIRIPRELPPTRLVALARRAEAAGLDDVWLVEDCFWPAGIAMAATALAVTERVSVGIGIMPAVARNPAVAAMDIAALAELHPGRLVAGFGHGMADWMRQIGAFPASQLAALEETVTAIRGLLAGDQVTMDGRHVHLDGVRLVFPPATPPPVITGVRGPKSLALSGRSADGTILAEPATPAYVHAAKAAIAADREHMIVTYNWFAQSQDPDEARARAAGALAATLDPSAAAQLAPLPFADDLIPLLGTPGLADGLRPDWVDALTISGTPETCAEKVGALFDAGVHRVVLATLPGEPEEEAIDAAGTLAGLLR